MEGCASSPPIPAGSLDVRDGTGGWTPILGAGQLIDTRVAPPEARGGDGHDHPRPTGPDRLRGRRLSGRGSDVSNVNARCRRGDGELAHRGAQRRVVALLPVERGGQAAVRHDRLVGAVSRCIRFAAASRRGDAPRWHDRSRRARRRPPFPREHRVYGGHRLGGSRCAVGAAGRLPARLACQRSTVIRPSSSSTLEQRLRGRPNQRCDVVRTPARSATTRSIAGGYNYPYWDPARFDRSIDSMIATLTSAGVKHVYWVTLREVKPQYISGAGVAPDPAVLLVLPHRQRAPRTGARSAPQPDAGRLGGARRPARSHV
jgi:hypothetical protein